MKQNYFEERYQPSWIAFEKQLTRLEKTSKKQQAFIEQDKNFLNNYQAICQQLALAQARGYSSLLASYLQQLVQRGHQLLYQHRAHLGQQIIQFILYGFPRVIRQEKRLVIIAHLLFYGVLLIAGTITWYFPDFINYFMSAAEVTEFEKMYDPAARIVGPMATRGSDTDWFMFCYYIYNNIGIAFQMFAGGLIFCVGALFYLIYNALVIGVVIAHIIQVGYGETFFPFIIGHGSFELTALIIAAAAGFKMGLAILFPKRKTRLEALRHASKNAIKLMLGAFFFLVIAAFIEGYWSSMNGATALRYSVGVLLWLLVFSYFAFAGRKGSQYAV